MVKFHPIEPKGDWNSTAVLVLPGRGGCAVDMSRRYAANRCLAKSLVVGVQPDYQWYPPPRGPANQKDAVEGLRHNVGWVQTYINDFIKERNVGLHRVALVGHSAGAVMAMHLAANTHPESWYAGVVSHSGCLLEPNVLPARVTPTPAPYRLYHAKDDNCFGWDERYLPTKKALQEKGYKVTFCEYESGGHGLSDHDVKDAGYALASWLA